MVRTVSVGKQGNIYILHLWVHFCKNQVMKIILLCIILFACSLDTVTITYKKSTGNWLHVIVENCAAICFAVSEQFKAGYVENHSKISVHQCQWNVSVLKL